MNKIKGMSHALIFFNTAAGEAATGIGAMMKLCFGSEEDSISQILYKRPEGSKIFSWVLPERTAKDGIYPIFTGKVAEELQLLVGRTAEQFKHCYTTALGLKVGRSWRVTKNGIEEITPTTAPAK